MQVGPVPDEAQAPAHPTVESRVGILERWRKRSAGRERRVIVQWLRRTASRSDEPHPFVRRRQALLHYRVAAVRADLLEIAATLERAQNPDPACVATLHELLANGCDSPLYNPDIHVSELRATLYSVRAGLQLLTAVGIAAVLIAFAGASAQAAVGSSVVPPGGKVAGEGYAYWLGLKDQLFFDSGGSTPNACETLRAPGGAVAFLNGGSIGGKINCDEPAGRPIYVDGVTNECSTFPGDHNGFGTSPEQLILCAREGFKGLSGTAAVDGSPIADYPALIAATNAIDVQVPEDNTFGIEPRSGRTAAYGEGLLLQGLSAGTHTIRVTSSTPAGTLIVEYTLRIH